IVCPLVEESEKTDLLAAVELREALAGGPLSGCRVDLLHGRMKSTEKESVMSRFRSGLIDVLVSTTVVEVGVDIPNATVMAIMDAHRFGLAQLHQLRGRVGRGGHPGNCFLIAGAGGQEQALRLEAMKTISDGFELAEKDLELRGPGELLGTRQWGESMYRMANPLRDARALAVAAEEARRLVERDPGFKEPGHRMIAWVLSSRFGKLAFLNIS
ncbi:MAG: helicase-related protein, partial [Desulfocucumaceae bacterium]